MSNAARRPCLVRRSIGLRRCFSADRPSFGLSCVATAAVFSSTWLAPYDGGFVTLFDYPEKPASDNILISHLFRNSYTWSRATQRQFTAAETPKRASGTEAREKQEGRERAHARAALKHSLEG